MMRVLIVHNPAAGFGSDSIFEFMRSLVRAGDECVLRLLTKDADDKGASLLSDAEAFDITVLSGGDGTVASLLYILRNRKVLTCIFPSGTANLLFANIGNTAEPAVLARTCRVAHSVETDLGEISWKDGQGKRQTQGFSIMAGIGFDAQIMQAAIPAKRTMGQAAYFAAALANPKPQVRRFKIKVDGEVHEHVGISCLVANNAMIQGDIDLIPGCTMTDGLLDVVVLEVDETAQLLHPLLAGIMDPAGKNEDRPHLTSYRGTDIQVVSSSPAQMEIDGDPVAQEVRAFRARVIDKCNRLIVDDLARYDHSGDPAPLFGDTEEMAFPL